MSILVLHKGKEQRRNTLSERAKLRKSVEPTLYNIIDHYQDCVFDRGNIETKTINYLWEGCPTEHIAGGRSVEDVKKNRRLHNWLCDRLLDLLNSGTVIAYHINDQSKSEKEFCYFCKKWTNQYENFCPRCRNWSSNLEDKGDKK